MPEQDLDELWDFQDAPASEARFRAVLQESGLSPDLRCEAMTQLARSLGLQRRFEEASKALDEATALSCTAPRPLIRIALERGRVFNSSGKKDESRPFFEKAWQIAVETGEEAFEIDAAHMVAIVAPPEEALEWNERAIATAERSSDPKARKWIGSLLNNTAWTYHDRGEYERALELFVKAMRFRMEQGKEPELKIARWCVARCLRSLGRLEEALSMQRELLKDHEAAGTGDGYVEEEMGELLLAIGKAEEAAPYFRRAHEMLSRDPWLAEQEPARLERLLKLAT